MSGGLAFVLDEDGTFRSRVNAAMLDQLEPLDEGDAIEVRELVAEHARRTGSPVGQRVLDEWAALAPRFVKVFPTDYKRVLAELARQEDEAAAPPDAEEFEGEAVDVVGAPPVRSEDGE